MPILDTYCSETVLAKLSDRKMNVCLMDTVPLGPFLMDTVWHKDQSFNSDEYLVM